MNIQTYNKIIAEKEKVEDPSKRKKARSGYTTAEIAFKKDLLRDKVVWHNRKCKDWCAYIKLNHPLFSLCCVPKEHPFGKCERLTVFLIMIGIGALVGLIQALIVGDDTDFKPGELLNDDGRRMKFIWVQLVSLGGGLIITFIEKVLVCCATCACCQRNSCPKCCRRLFECIGDAFLLVWFLIVAAECAGVSYLVGLDSNDLNTTAYLLGLAETTVLSWVTAFFKMGFCFCRKWKKEKQNKGKKLNKLKVNYIEYELYVNGNQVEIPPNYRASRTSTIGSIGSATEAGRTSSIGSIQSTSPTSVSVQMSPVSSSPQPIYVDANGNPIQMAPASPSAQIVYVQQPPNNQMPQMQLAMNKGKKGRKGNTRPVVVYKGHK